ncbi:hypothetical protein [Glaciihabitans sp. dw_435]|uniref:hypothetical protein n=1 Tax=Glaciihabitans sp. dw_435 TaxID=2720081 RepID=UPI001BD6C182|nr:hypothetical protein [Glaciihabitans sp. dw_435]
MADSATRGSRLRHVGNGALLAAILAVAAVVSHSTPDAAMQQSPITVAGIMDTAATGRNITATVHSIEAATSVTAGNGWKGTTPGVWVVAEISAQAVVDDESAPLGTAVLRAGDVTFSASTRPGDATVAVGGLATGIARSGPLMFELPRDVLTGAAAATAQLELAIDSDPRADSLLVFPVDLSSLDIQPTITTEFPTWGTK